MSSLRVVEKVFVGEDLVSCFSEFMLGFVGTSLEVAVRCHSLLDRENMIVLLKGYKYNYI